MLSLSLLPLELVAKIVQHLPLATLQVLKDTADPAVAAMAKATYYSDLVVVALASGYEGGSGFGRLQVLWEQVEALLNEGVVLRHLTIMMDDKNWSLHVEKLTKLASRLPECEVILRSWELERFSMNDLVAVHDKVVGIDASFCHILHEIPVLPSRLRRFSMKIYDCPSWERTEGRVVFPETLVSLAIDGEWVPLANWGPVPPGLRTLKLENFVAFSASLFNRLELGGLRVLLLGTLPSLTCLDGSFHLPALLRTLTLCNELLRGLRTPYLPLGLTRLEIRDSPLHEWEPGELPALLLSLSIERTQLTSALMDRLRFPKGIRSIQITDTKIDSLAFLANLPPLLNHLDLRRNRLGTEHQRQKVTSLKLLGFPPGLVSLNLGGNTKLFTGRQLNGLALPSGLKALCLNAMGLKTLDGLALPATLTDLNLEGNALTELKLALPSEVCSVDLSNNNLTRFHLPLPPSLNVLSLKANKIVDMEIELPSSCSQLNLGGNPLWRLRVRNAVVAGAGLTHLQLWGASPPSFGEWLLLKSLQSLVIHASSLPSLAELIMPLGLRKLEVMQCQLKTLKDVRLPEGLSVLVLSHNDLTSLKGVWFPPLLTEFDVRCNRLETMEGFTYSPSLQCLLMSGNPLPQALDLRSPEALQRFFTMELDTTRP